MKALWIMGNTLLVLSLCAVSFVAGIRASRIVGPSPRAFVASITTPNTQPASREAVLATPHFGDRLSAGCLFTPIDDTGLYFDPENRQRICAVPPDVTIEPGTELTPGEGAQMPFNCAVAPDQNVYCSPGWALDAFFLQRLYERGELPSD
jgi:hypothetical protein